MPESEPKPKLIELVAPGAGQGWKAVLKNGKAVVVHEIPVPAAEAVAAIPRIQRLFENRHPSLSPVLAWGTDPNGLWVAVEPNEGVPLGTILSRGPLTPAAAAALGAGLLSGVSALHEAGISMGGFGASSVRVNGNGEVRLSGHPLAAARGAPSQSDLRADVRSSGMAICAAFGVDPAGAPAPPNIPPGLVVTMRSMASGAMGPAADRAQGALREMASALLSPDRMVSSQAELALRAGGREMPITPFLPKTDAAAPAPAAPAPAPYVPPAPREETPLPTAASYDAPPAPPPVSRSPWGPQPSTPPTPSPFPTPAAPPAPAPAASTSPPAPPPVVEPLPVVVPPPAPPAPAPPPPEPPAHEPPRYEPPRYEPPKYEPIPPPPAAAPYVPIPVPEREIEPAHAPYFEPVTPAPRAKEQPAWTPASSADLPSYVATPVPEPASSTSPPGRVSAVARRPVERTPSERPSWMQPAIIAVAIIVLLAIGGGIFLATRGNHPTVGGNPTASPSTGQSPKASPTPVNTGPKPVPVYAPASADPITSVAYQPSPDTSCSLGSSCKVSVEIKFSTVQRGNVAYVLKFFDRCTGLTTDLPGNNFTPPGFTTVDILTGNVQLPPGAKSAGLVAVTTSPSTAASPPLPLGGDTC
jgi:hypothetical protein